MTKAHTPASPAANGEIMDILYRRGRATAAEVLEDLPGDTHYSTVRTQLRVLEEKGHVHHEEGAPSKSTAAVGRTGGRTQVRIAPRRADVLRQVG